MTGPENSFLSRRRKAAARKSRPPRDRKGRRLLIEPLETRRMLSLSTVTELVSDINPVIAATSPTSLVQVGSSVYFIEADAAGGAELWKSDGTSGGTVMVDDINSGKTNSIPGFLTNVNGTLFFQANDGTHGAELWKSDGTSSGTVMVDDIQPGSANSSPANLTNVNRTLFFQANDGTHGYELWKSNGTSSGTVMVPDGSVPGTASIANLAAVGGTLFFNDTDPLHGAQLWATQNLGPPAFTLTGPTSGAFTAGQSVTVNWTAAGVTDSTTTVTLCYDTATDWSGAKLIEAYQVQAQNGTGTYVWNTTGIGAGTYYLCGMMYDSILPSSTAIYSHLGTGQAITISNPAGPLSFTMTGPTSGAFTAGVSVTITWTAAGVTDSTTTVTLAYDTATNWSGAQTIEAYQVLAQDGAGTYVWNTMGIGAGTYYLCGMMYDSILPSSTAIYSHLGTGQAITINLV